MRLLLLYASLLLAFQRLAHIVLALFSGPVADRIGAGRLLLPCSLVVACGLGAIALGWPGIVRKPLPRLCRMTPLSGAMIPVPNAENSELMNDTAMR